MTPSIFYTLKFHKQPRPKNLRFFLSMRWCDHKFYPNNNFPLDSFHLRAVLLILRYDIWAFNNIYLTSQIVSYYFLILTHEHENDHCKRQKTTNNKPPEPIVLLDQSRASVKLYNVFCLPYMLGQNTKTSIFYHCMIRS